MALLKHAPEDLEKQNAVGLTPAQIRSRKGEIAPEVWNVWETKPEAARQGSVTPPASTRRRAAIIAAGIAAAAVLAGAGALFFGYLDLEAWSAGFRGQ